MLRAGKYYAGKYKGGGYGGEAVEKKLARLFFWLAVQDYLGEKQFLQGKYLALASEEAGDAMTLHGLGVPYENIVLAEIDKQACLAARKKVPLVAVYNEDVLLTAHRFQTNYFDAVFLDYCGNVTEACLIRSAAVAQRSVNVNGVLGMGIHVGREADIDKMPTVEDDAAERRARYIKSEMKKRIDLHARAVIKYTAVHPHRSVPMCIYMGTWMKGTCRSRPVPTGDALKACMAVWFEYFDNKGMDVALIFNIPRTSVAPMRAHITRGTYK